MVGHFILSILSNRTPCLSFIKRVCTCKIPPQNEVVFSVLCGQKPAI